MVVARDRGPGLILRQELVSWPEPLLHWRRRRLLRYCQSATFPAIFWRRSMRWPPDKIGVVQVSSGASCNASLPSTRRGKRLASRGTTVEARKSDERRVASLLGRLTPSGSFVPMSAQLPRRMHSRFQREGEESLQKAAKRTKTEFLDYMLFLTFVSFCKKIGLQRNRVIVGAFGSR